MGRKKFTQFLLENVRIENLAAEGKSISRFDNKVIFAPFGAPGDLVDLWMIRDKKRFFEAEIRTIHEKGADRIEPKCSHFGICGGCKWQHIDYAAQIKHKQQQVEDQLVRIGGLELPGIQTIMGSETIYAYRNKLEFTFSEMRWLKKEEIESGDDFDRRGLGFHIPGSFDKVLDIHQCYLHDSKSDEIRQNVRDYALAHNIPFFNLKSQEGVLRTLVIRTSNLGDTMVILQAKERTEQVDQLLAHMQSTLPQITTLMLIINAKANDTYQDLEVETIFGKDHMIEEMEGLQFKIGPKAFFQTNSQQALRLYQKTRELAEITSDDLVYDLYTGTGTIALFMAKYCKKVIGIEYVASAIENAKENAVLNAIDNSDFYAGDMKDVLNNDFIAQHGTPDVVITDPPRSGMHEDVVNVLLTILPRRIVYVSCNPATQARDLQLLCSKYDITQVQPVDMFPHTHHVENIVALTRNNF